MIKKVLFSLIIPLICISCFNNSVNTSINIKEINFKGAIKGETLVVTLSGDAAWNIEQPMVDWFSITPLEGEGTAEITVTTNSINESITPRVADVKINVQDAPTISLKISQSGSTEEELTDGIIHKTAVGLYSKGLEVYVLDKKSGQQGFNKTSMSWRLVSDDQTKIVSGILNKKPVIGEVINVSLQTKGITPKFEQRLTCKVYKEQDNKFWMYDTNEKKGFIISIN